MSDAPRKDEQDDDEAGMTQKQRDELADRARNIEGQMVVLKQIERKGVYWPGDDL